MFHNKNKKHDWSNDGSFMSKPKQGWLHPNENLHPDAGVVYQVKYTGCLAVLESMRALDFDTRTCITNESINRLCYALGLKNPQKYKKNQKLNKYLGLEPNISYSCIDVNLTITTESLTITSIRPEAIIFQHPMPSISFASGGELDTQDFVAYVAKGDEGRACHVLECRAGLSRDVITTIGQAFEIRFKSYLSQRAIPLTVPDCVPVYSSKSPPPPYMTQTHHSSTPLPPPPPPSTITTTSEAEYYNDANDLQQRSSPSELHRHHHHHHHHHHFDEDDGVVVDGGGDDGDGDVVDGVDDGTDHYCHRRCQGVGTEDGQEFSPKSLKAMQNVNQSNSSGLQFRSPTSSSTSSLQGKASENEGICHSVSRTSLSPYNEIWFHGRITRPKTEELLTRTGDFLVRESPNSPGQFVLSGRQGANVKHLLLVDPEGKVRTKDQLFTSVSHLVNYHLYNQVPIISNDSELLLTNPIHCTSVHQ